MNKENNGTLLLIFAILLIGPILGTAFRLTIGFILLGILLLMILSVFFMYFIDYSIKIINFIKEVINFVQYLRAANLTYKQLKKYQKYGFTLKGLYNPDLPDTINKLNRQAIDDRIKKGLMKKHI